ncbi:MAG: metallophosphoesterase, partial [Candidatus Omnitrophota bacterium]
MKTFAIGDIHGAYKALIQCFERSKFDYKKDRLIVMGDVCDGYPDVKQCIDELLKVTRCDLVIGNHD